jgi:predicted transcriptional regulator
MGNSGPGRKPEVSDKDILSVFRQAADPVLTTSEVADQLEIRHRGTFDRLNQLASEGRIHKKKVGEKGTVWWSEEALRKRY